ncbi:single-stranded DNA-binding protein [Intrasporangium sp. YIM S08009]|uniref:single-stranded DNA-binding protein n=1 Tax=Intrasporangium zincisolvens TaxID=3080018 RepID=UPI002B057B0A|nr:single-stranded DNA-binding protein [Intrasporangium sp. YIM S08009]
MATDTTTPPRTRSARTGRRKDAAASGSPDAATALGNEPGNEPCNEVRLRGRVGAPAEERTLPSGDVIVTFRVVVARPPVRGAASAAARTTGATGATGAAVGEPRGARATVDTLDVVCWAAGARRTAGRLGAGDVVEVEGALRRRFFGVAGGRASRYEVEAARVRRVSGGRRSGT